MAGLGRKVFTAGDVLTASDVQSYLMDQTIMNFAGTAARSSAIATPTTGMTTYIGTTGTATIPQLEVYTGSAFQTPYGLTQVANVSFSSVTTVNIDNVFTTTYDRYVVYLDFTSTVGTDSTLSWNLRTGGVTNTTANYIQQRLLGFNTSVVASLNVTGTSLWSASFVTASYATYYQSILNINKPALVAPTSVIQNILTRGSDLTLYTESHAQNFTATTTFDGIALATGGTSMSGRIRIYGIRNS